MAQVAGVVDLAAEAQTDIPTLTRARWIPPRRRGRGSRRARSPRRCRRRASATSSGRFSKGRSRFRWSCAMPIDGAGDGADLSAIGRTQIQTPDRRQIPLAAVATIREDRGPNFVMRENVQRRIVVQSNVSGPRSAQRRQRHPGARGAERHDCRRAITSNTAGSSRARRRRRASCCWLSIGVIVAIFFILSAAFGSSRDGLLIMLNLPLALIGGVVGVYLAGGVLSVASIVGFITLFGIATRNGIMLVSHIRHLQEHEGVTDFRTAVVRGATERLVPILMTALAAGLALVPIALSAGEPGSEIQAPMAMVIMFGLVSSTALNMIVVPVLYARFGRPVAFERRLDAGRRVTGLGSMFTG